MMTHLASAAHRPESSSPVPAGTTWVVNVLARGYHRYRSGGAWSPAVDLYEGRDEFHVVVELAGAQADTIAVRAQGRTLIVTGLRPAPQLPCRSRKVRTHLMEIDQGPFERAIEIPAERDIDRFEAVFRCGLLWVRVPKRS